MKRLLLTLLVWAMLAAPAWAACEFVAQVFSACNNVTSCAPTINSVAAGELLVASIAARNAPAITGVSDGTNGAWTQAVTQVFDGTERVWIFYFANSASGNLTVTATWGSNAQNVYMNVQRVAGCATASVLDQVDDQLTVGSTSHSHGSMTVADNAYVSATTILFSFGVTKTSTDSFTQLTEDESGSRGYHSYRNVTTGGTVTGAWTASASVSALGVMASFLPASEAAAPRGLMLRGAGR